jgi:toxin ParE1/3/4
MPCIYKQAQAKQDLIDIWFYTFGQWGETQANTYLDDLEVALFLLAEQPLICRERTEFIPPVRIHHHAHHLIVYLVVDDGINIVRVLHEHMDINAKLSDA